MLAHQPKHREIHIIVDNLSAHKTQRVEEFLTRHKNVTIHYTPTYSSWLNQVELWFGKIERDVIARGIFSSTSDLRRKIMRYIREGNKSPKPIKWTYSDLHNRD
jgi:transposase